ncbi:MAG TPA: type II toxin-antitoxin system VapC family toxin [Stellaceae bacterium]
MVFLLDTNAVIALLRGPDSKLARRTRQHRPTDIGMSAIVAHELFYGAFKSRRVAQNLALVDALQFTVIEFDKEDSRRAGEIRAFLAGAGTPIGPYDVLIAGQALARDLILITRNRGEFSRVPNLRLEDWEE